MNRIDFKLNLEQDLKPEGGDFFETYASYIFYQFLRLGSRAADEAMNRQCCENKDESSMLRKSGKAGTAPAGCQRRQGPEKPSGASIS